MEDVTQLFIKFDSPIQDAMQCIDQNEQGIALIVDEDRKLIGTVVDGDIRRAILANIDMQAPVKVLLARKPAQYANPITAHLDDAPTTVLELMNKNNILQMPLLDDDGRVVDLFHINDLIDYTGRHLPLQAVLMAGGFGTRLRPLTEDIPKPMLPVGDRPLMEYTIERMRKAGIQHINVTTHYLPEKIRKYFGDGSNFDVTLNYVNEDHPLGTAGGVGLVDTPDETLLVMNGDLLTGINFREMYEFHHSNKALLTVAVRKYEYKMPYGIVESEGVYVQRLVEKPTYNFFVNAGIYLLEPEAHRMITRNERMDMTDLIDKLIEGGYNVASFPLREYWLDIGQHADYLRAQDDFEQGLVDD